MVDVISLSSDDSDVEFVSCYPEVKPPPPPPSFTPDGVTYVSNRLPLRFNHHPGRTFPQVRTSVTPPSSAWTPSGFNLTEQEETPLPVTAPYVPAGTNRHRTEASHKNGRQKSSSADMSVVDSQRDCGNTKIRFKCLNSQTPKGNYEKPDLNTERVSSRRTSTDSEYTRRNTVNFAEPHICQEQRTFMNGFTSIDDVKPYHTSPHSTTPHLTARPSGSFDSNHFPHRSSVFHNPECDVVPAEKTFDFHLEEFKVEGASDHPGSLSEQSPMSVFRTEDEADGLENGDYRGMDSPLFVENEDDDDEESKFDERFRAASQEDRDFVCPLALKKLMSGPSKTPISQNGLETKTSEQPKVLCRQSLGLVYITIDENYTEATLQLLSDLIQPGHYPPRDISTHLLRNILLRPLCPHHLCVQAFGLLMRSQRHHRVDKTTVPWDWNMLTTVMANQDSADRQPCSVIRMFLDYIVQTLEDDFQAKRSASALNQSITKSLLSCDQQFSQVRAVIKWLFSAIMESGESRDGAKEGDELIRIVCSLQRMLSLALEVDQSPALSSVKLSRELFHMLISNVTLRAQRMLLLESLQSTLLRWKLLELLLDYSCPLKTTIPMSLSLMLHFMKNCILAPDSMDGAERWRKWEELVRYLWMLLLGYKATRGYLCSSAGEQRPRSSSVVFGSEDRLSKPAIHDAVDSFLSRSKDDIGQALPLHVEQSFMYLQEYLLEICQC